MAKNKEDALVSAVKKLFHEWHGADAEKLLKMMGVSERNWAIYARHMGLADGEQWTFADLADEYKISRQRAHQIFNKTTLRTQQFCEKMNLKIAELA